MKELDRAWLHKTYYEGLQVAAAVADPVGVEGGVFQGADVEAAVSSEAQGVHNTHGDCHGDQVWTRAGKHSNTLVSHWLRVL